jgi:hypothetical protein
LQRKGIAMPLRSVDDTLAARARENAAHRPY